MVKQMYRKSLTMTDCMYVANWYYKEHLFKQFTFSPKISH